MVRFWPAILFVMILLGVRTVCGQTDSFVCGVSDDADFSARLASSLSKTGPDTMDLAVIYVDFADDGDYPLDANMETVVWERLNDYYVMQSDSLLFFQTNVISTYDLLDPVWTARYPANVYGDRDTVLAIPSNYGGELHQGCWVENGALHDENANPLAADYLGELQSEIVSQIDSVYTGRPNPFIGCDMVVFIYLTAFEPIAPGVGGFAALNIRRSCYDILDPVPLEPNHDEDAILGLSTIWRDAGNINNSFGSILAHEFGHVLGLQHPTYSVFPQCSGQGSTDDCHFGPYSIMRRFLLEDHPFLPMADFNRLSLGWLDEISVESSLYGCDIYDVNDPSNGGLVYRVPISSWSCSGASGSWDAEEYFLISYRSGNTDDGYLVPSGTMYLSQGLVIWHLIKMHHESSIPIIGLNDLEIASGLFEDPENELLGNTVYGSDSLDNWYSITNECMDRMDEASKVYRGDAHDFFNQPYADEFSFRTNPNTFGFYLSDWCAAGDELNRLGRPQDQPNSIVVKILPGSTTERLKVDILLAPYEPLTEPAAGETIVAGHPLRIQWDREYTIDTADGIIDAVDLLYSANNWATQDTVVVDADAASGEYLWTPGTEHVAQGGQICAVYRNIYTAHVGSDTLQSVRVGNPTSYPDLVATNTLPAHDNVWPQLAVASNKRGAKIYVNAAQIGWGDAPVSLSDSDGDGTYTYQGPPVAGYEGTYSLPTTIYLANGNKEFYGLAVEVVDGTAWESLAPADLAVFALPKIGGTPTVVATEVGSGAVYEIESVEVDVSPLASEGTPSTWISLAEDLVVSGSQMAPNIWANDSVTVDGDRSAGFYDLPVRVCDEFGHLYQSSVRVTVVDELIPRFDDKSADTGQLEQLGGAPFSSASLNIGMDLYSMEANDLIDEDLLVTIQGAESKLFDMTSLDDYIPQFAQSFDIQGLDLWHDVRGVAVADVDNDGYEDLFLAHDQDPRLYRWDNTAGEFVNATTSLFNPGPPLNSYAAAWGDYNLDGFVDLIVGCSPSAVSQLDPTGQMATAPVLLYRNDGSGVLQQITDTSEFPSVAVAGLNVLWNDVDGDGDQDLFLGDASATGGSRLLINGGPETGFTFTDQTSTWFPAGTGPTRVVAAEFVELTGDGFADLALAHLGASDNLTFYESTGTSYQLVDKQIANLPNIAVGLNGLISGDFDLNGGMDLLLLPYLTTDSPRMFLNGMNSPLGVFARVPAIEGLDLGALNGAVVHDWGDDGDLDLFFGREPAAGLTTADNFFFRSKWSEVDDGPPIDKRYVKIRVVSDLIDDGGTLRRALVNNTGIGTKVSINAGSFDQTQWTSGGNGRGGQNSRTLLFGIGGYPDDTLQATVTWPDGRNTFHLVHVDSTNIIRDDGLFLIDESSIQVNGVAPNADIEFVWNASRPMESLRVLLDPSPGSIGGDQSECYCGTNGFVQIFDETTPGVATSVENLGDGWFRHSLVYDGWCCEPGCEFDYQVSGTSGQETLTSAWYSKSAGTCGVEIRLRNSFE